MLVAVPFGEIEPGDVQIHQCPFELRWVAALGAQFARVVCRFGQQRAGGPSWTGDRRVFGHHLFHIAVADDQPRRGCWFLAPQPGLNSGTFSPARNSLAAALPFCAASFWLNCSSSALAQPTLFSSIFPSAEIQNRVGTLVSP